MSLNAFFSRHPVFTTSEIADELGERGSHHAGTRQAILAHHLRQGRIVRVRRGLYAVVPFGVAPDDWLVDPILVASRLTGDAVLAYHTALEVHGRAHSFRHVHTAVTAQTTGRPFSFQGITYRTLAQPAALTRAGCESVAVVDVDRMGLDVRVTSLERTLVDVMGHPALGGGWEEIWRSLESVPYWDIGQVAAYAMLLGNATTVAKVGFFLEQHQAALAIHPSELNVLRQHRPRSPHYMDAEARGAGRFVEAWNLVVPEPVLTRRWDELDEA